MWTLICKRIFASESLWSITVAIISPKNASCGLVSSVELCFAALLIAYDQGQVIYATGELWGKNQQLRQLRRVLGIWVCDISVFKMYIYFVILIFYFVILLS